MLLSAISAIGHRHVKNRVKKSESVGLQFAVGKGLGSQRPSIDVTPVTRAPGTGSRRSIAMNRFLCSNDGQEERVVLQYLSFICDV